MLSYPELLRTKQTHNHSWSTLTPASPLPVMGWLYFNVTLVTRFFFCFVFLNFAIFAYSWWGSWQMGATSKHEIHLCFTYTSDIHSLRWFIYDAGLDSRTWCDWQAVPLSFMPCLCILLNTSVEELKFVVSRWFSKHFRFWSIWHWELKYPTPDRKQIP